MKLLAFFLTFTAFFFIANRGATKGYFDGDDLDNLNMTNQVSEGLLLRTFFSPKLDQSNFRPLGHAFYHYFGRQAGLNYPSYIYAIQAMHLLNVILLWLVLRALGFEPVNAAFGLLLFAFNMGTFEIYWKPMYLFDLFCATFTLTSILLWLRDRWVLSWIAFWCAFRSKEVAIALPVVLLLLEYVRGSKRWKQLIPFFLVSLNFGLQAILGNRGRDDAYTFRLTWNAFQTCLSYYGDRILLIPYGAALIGALALVKDKRAQAGVLALICFMGPLLFLPGRLFGAYLYVPLIGLAIAAAAFSTKAPRIVSLLLMLLWLPWNYREMQTRRKEQLAIADQNRDYTQRVFALMKQYQETAAFVFDKSPGGLHSWGVRNAVGYAIRPKYGFKEAEIHSKEALALNAEPNLAFLMWVPERNHFYQVIRTAKTPDIPYIAMNEKTPLWQLGDGWHGLESNFQWTNLVAEARIARPAGSTQFETLVNVGPQLIEKLKKVKLEVILDGVKIGEQEFDSPGWRVLKFPAPPSSAPTAQVQFKSSPGFFYDDHNPADALGMAISGFGFPTQEYPSVAPPPVQ